MIIHAAAYSPELGPSLYRVADLGGAHRREPYLYSHYVYCFRNLGFLMCLPYPFKPLLMVDVWSNMRVF